MVLKSLKCPSCGSAYDPSQIRCKYCRSYIIMSNEKYVDYSKENFESDLDNEKYTGIYVYGTLLGQGEKPINLGEANYYKGIYNVGGKLLLTNKTLSFSSHTFMQGKTDAIIKLNDIESVKLESNLLISQIISVTALGKKHKFVVYHGNDWVSKIIEAKQNINNNEISDNDNNNNVKNGDYIEELKKLKELLDQGIISQEEFDLKKRMLLNI